MKCRKSRPAGICAGQRGSPAVNLRRHDFRVPASRTSRATRRSPAYLRAARSCGSPVVSARSGCPGPCDPSGTNGAWFRRAIGRDRLALGTVCTIFVSVKLFCYGTHSRRAARRPQRRLPPLHEIPDPQNPARLLQLRRLHPRGGWPHRIPHQGGVPRPEPLESTRLHPRELHGRSPRPARTGRQLRLRADHVQRGHARRLRVRQAGQSDAPRTSHRPAHQLFAGHLPPAGGAGPLGHRRHLLLARQHRPDYRPHQARRRPHERRRRHPAGRGAEHPARGGFDPLLLDLPARALPADPVAEHRIPEGRLQRRPVDPAQTLAAQNPAGDQFRGCAGPI